MIIKTGLVYRNARGDEFDFDARGVYARPDPLMDWEYGVSELNGALAAYRRDPKDLEFECSMGDPGLLRRQMDDLYEVAAYDLANNLQGTLAVRGWEARASLVKSEKAGWWLPSGPVSYTLAFRLQDPQWTRGLEWSFPPASGSLGGLDYPHDYAFDYGYVGSDGQVEVPGPYPADFRLTVFGPASSPSVRIGPNSYSADVEVPDGSLLVIDSLAGTCELVDRTGASVSVLGDTPDGSDGGYVFEQMPPGRADVSWSGEFGFDLVVYERRDEMVWSEGGWSD